MSVSACPLGATNFIQALGIHISLRAVFLCSSEATAGLWVQQWGSALSLPVVSFPSLSPFPQGGAWAVGLHQWPWPLVDRMVEQALAAGSCPRYPHCLHALDALLLPSNYYFLW